MSLPPLVFTFFLDVGKEEEVVDVDALTPNSSKPPAKKIKLEPKDRHNSGDALAQQKQARMNDLCDLMKVLFFLLFSLYCSVMGMGAGGKMFAFLQKFFPRFMTKSRPQLEALIN